MVPVSVTDFCKFEASLYYDLVNNARSGLAGPDSLRKLAWSKHMVSTSLIRPVCVGT